MLYEIMQTNNICINHTNYGNPGQHHMNRIKNPLPRLFRFVIHTSRTERLSRPSVIY